jgi:transcriptional regulator with XRE-family HTH domain
MQRKNTPIHSQETELLASELARNLGRKLRYLRAMRGWTQIELSRRATMSRAYVGRLERGNVLPRYITLVRLAACLGVTPAELVRTEARADCNGTNEL